MKPRLLMVDDDETIRTQMKWALAADYEVLLAEDRIGALEMFKGSHPAVTMLDLGLPPSPNQPDEGLAVLAEFLALDRSAKVIIISGQGCRGIRLSLQAGRLGRAATSPPALFLCHGTRARIP
jgi:two-component system NtrC family response regulator